MTHNEQRVYLIRNLLSEKPEYKGYEIPEDEQEQKDLLRGLMNVRMPSPMGEAVLRMQDEYLRERAEEKGIVRLSDIPTVAEAIGSSSPFADSLSIWQGDITRLGVDAIVNAANSQMLGCFVPMHSCIDNCIHTYAGVQLRAECDRQMRRLRSQYGRDYEQPTAVPMLTDAYNLPAKKVIHIVGPIVGGALTPALERDLIDCYKNTLDMCAENDLRSVAFCCISTGVFHFPNERAAELAVATVREYFEKTNSDIRVIFNVFMDIDREIYESLV